MSEKSDRGIFISIFRTLPPIGRKSSENENSWPVLP
nr:MAG TPA: hypothetical protein [Bacteriophage sp.]